MFSQATHASFLDAIMEAAVENSERYMFEGEDTYGITERYLLTCLRQLGWSNIPGDGRFEVLAKAAGLTRVKAQCYRNDKVSTATAYIFTVL